MNSMDLKKYNILGQVQKNLYKTIPPNPHGRVCLIT